MGEWTAVFAWERGSGEIAWCGPVLAVVLRDVVLLGHGLVLLLLHGRASLWVECCGTVLGYLLRGGEAGTLAASDADPDDEADESANGNSSGCDATNDSRTQVRVMVIIGLQAGGCRLRAGSRRGSRAS